MQILQVTENPTKTPLILYASRVRAGFPSPAEDYVEGQLDLNEHLIARPAATFLIRVVGDSMIEAGIFPNDLLVVDRSLPPVHDSIVVAVVDGELTVKRLFDRFGQLRLEAANPAYPAIQISGDMELWCWGVVTSSIHEFTRAGKPPRRKPGR
ncbi:MAG TPA: translesion error-prone DNA polymerase V autoproteolytic subunit [Alphaproteobacteria bacterium]|jgi:DNA polymerase V